MVDENTPDVETVPEESIPDTTTDIPTEE